MWKQALAGIVLAACTAPAMAGSCPAKMHDVDRALENEAKVSKLSESELNKVRELRAKGEELHNSGRHGKSVEVLEQALSILGESGGYGY